MITGLKNPTSPQWNNPIKFAAMKRDELQPGVFLTTSHSRTPNKGRLVVLVHSVIPSVIKSDNPADKSVAITGDYFRVNEKDGVLVPEYGAQPPHRFYFHKLRDGSYSHPHHTVVMDAYYKRDGSLALARDRKTDRVFDIKEV